MRDEFSPGDILYVFRGLYFHYGVYIGHGKVIHFSGGRNAEIFGENKIIKTSLSKFAKDGTIEVCNREVRDSPAVIVERAKSMLGSEFGGYNLVSNNCEHFARWCENGERTSAQVDFVESLIDETLGNGSGAVGGFARILGEIFLG